MGRLRTIFIIGTLIGGLFALIALLVQVPPEVAVSNLQAWAEYFGLENVPSWVGTAGADQVVTWLAVAGAVISFGGVASLAVRRAKRRAVSREASGTRHDALGRLHAFPLTDDPRVPFSGTVPGLNDPRNFEIAVDIPPSLTVEDCPKRTPTEKAEAFVLVLRARFVNLSTTQPKILKADVTVPLEVNAIKGRVREVHLNPEFAMDYMQAYKRAVSRTPWRQDKKNQPLDFPLRLEPSECVEGQICLVVYAPTEHLLGAYPGDYLNFQSAEYSLTLTELRSNKSMTFQLDRGVSFHPLYEAFKGTRQIS
jgi:hypothetical protein